MKYQKTAKLLKMSREKLKLSQSDVSNLIGLHPQYCSNWERGICLVPMNKLAEICYVLKIGRIKFMKAIIHDETAHRMTELKKVAIEKTKKE